jgi:hypothetical protein
LHYISVSVGVLIHQLITTSAATFQNKNAINVSPYSEAIPENILLLTLQKGDLSSAMQFEQI